MYDIVIYHRDCADGFTAAWAAKGALPDGTSFVSANYDDKHLPFVEGYHVLVVDFSYSKNKLAELLTKGALSVTILDHHKSAQEDLAEFMVGSDGEVNLDPPDVFAAGCAELEVAPIRAWFDMERSGAQLAWSYFYGGLEPNLVAYVGDRDLWKSELYKSREVSAFVFSHDFDFNVWSDLQVKLEDHMSNVTEEGTALLRQHDKDVRDMLKLTQRGMIIGGYNVPVANLPYTMASDGAGMMAALPDAPFAAVYFDKADGGRKFSLRSSKEHGIDVSEIARRYGGGGHKHSASFTIPYQFEFGSIEIVGTPEQNVPLTSE